ncbi:STAS/SEC14 domain-containing protein [Planococcus versutus]|uniref:STAS/SEC14 domain-containing protein n=1 Tax=Planococcus versutus TaxID=1302659 RepID=A0A1B1S0F9_9BACL|nr:STAS/SEC14 domain-containing protein [Planococcus versutus]ANU26681.1 hypothetical protein I858_006535 [Planococcus versutus]
MLSFIPSQDSTTIAFELNGTATKEDLLKLEQAIGEQFSDDQQFNAFAVMQKIEVPTIKALIEESKIDMKYGNQYNKLAVIGEKKLLETITKLSNVMPGVKARYFEIDEAEQAWNWIKNKQFE